MSKPALVLLLATMLSACSLADFYDKEYTIYDPSKTAAPGSPGRASQDAKDAERAARTTDPAIAVGSDPVTDRSGAAVAASAAADVDRIFMLQNLLDELMRAEREGVGDPARLTEKRAQIETEITWRKAEAGPLYDRARALRVDQLTRFPVVLK